MRGRRETRRAPVPIIATGLVLGLALPAAGGADPSPQAGTLRQHQTALAGRSRAALLSLYSIDARLAQTRSRLAALRARASALHEEQTSAVQAETIAADAWRKSVAALGARLRELYEQSEPDALAVVLDASSFDDAVSRLNALERTARLNRDVIEQARSSHQTLAALRRKLAAQAERAQALETQTAEYAGALAQTRAQHVAYLASLARQRALNARQIAGLEASAKRIAARSRSIAPQEAVLPVAAPAAVGERQLTVTATGYSLSGHTATGMPVGWGVVAVDPSVIPLGTQISIPGYGEGVAADTGSAVRGATIDLWFPTLAQALAWGRRTVTITLH